MKNQEEKEGLLEKSKQAQGQGEGSKTREPMVPKFFRVRKKDELVKPEEEKYFEEPIEPEEKKGFMENLLDKLRPFLMKVPGLIYAPFFQDLLTPTTTLTRYVKKEYEGQSYWVEDENMTWTGKKQREPDPVTMKNGKIDNTKRKITSEDAVISYRRISPTQFHTGMAQALDPSISRTVHTELITERCREESEFIDDEKTHIDKEGRKFNFYFRTTICREYDFGSNADGASPFTTIDNSPVKIAVEKVVRYQDNTERPVNHCRPVFAQAWPAPELTSDQRGELKEDNRARDQHIYAENDDFNFAIMQPGTILEKIDQDLSANSSRNAKLTYSSEEKSVIEGEGAVLYKVKTSYKRPPKDAPDRHKITKSELENFMTQILPEKVRETTLEHPQVQQKQTLLEKPTGQIQEANLSNSTSKPVSPTTITPTTRETGKQ